MTCCAVGTKSFPGRRLTARLVGQGAPDPAAGGDLRLASVCAEHAGKLPHDAMRAHPVRSVRNRMILTARNLPNTL